MIKLFSFPTLEMATHWLAKYPQAKLINKTLYGNRHVYNLFKNEIDYIKQKIAVNI